MGWMACLVPSCNDGNEHRNAWWHFGFAVLSLGSIVFHLASVVHHLQEDQRKKGRR